MGRFLERLRRLRGESGVTLVEIAITLAIFSMVSALLMNTLATTSTATAHVDDQNRGLADLQTVSERMSRDLRVARGIDTGATASQLTIWIDSDSDYKRETEESVTWRIKCRSGIDCGSDERQYDVERVVGDPDEPQSVHVVGQSLVSGIAFEYLLDGVATLDHQAATSVKVSMQYDAIVDAFAKLNIVDFEVRLRNVQ
jgi:type II secretory pathway pseudopilin PulG